MKIGIIALALLTVAGCASGPRGPVYERADSQYDEGYSETRIDDNRYVVRYRTDASDRTLAQDWALRRAAELTLDQRYDWFQVISRSRAFSDDSFERYERMRIYDREGDRYSTRPRYDARYDDDTLAVIEVLMGSNPPPRGSSIYNARQVLEYTPRRY